MTFFQMVRGFARQHFGPRVEVRVEPLKGGLEARGIARVIAYQGEEPVGSFVAKPFTMAMFREVDIYRLLAAVPSSFRLSPELLGWRHTRKTEGYAFLEWVAADRAWPWRNVSRSLLVVERLAWIHRTQPTATLRAALARWHYERELEDSAHWTLDAYRRVFRHGTRPGNRPMIRALDRLVTHLPRLRRELLGFSGVTLLHGDAHPGNVVLTKTAGSEHPVFIDWARARMGSPLEDISSWVHSLSLWEPEAKRRHDMLLKRYLVARGDGSTLSSTFREACVLAGACNALAGALRYHLSVLEAPETSPRAKFESYRAAADWLRILRRADECFAVA
jgi:hypothetical protein